MAEPQRDLVFISYSHLDKKWLSDLLTFLKPYQRKGMEVWADPYIKVGSRWERDINHALSRACVGVLLVSQEFLASDFIYESELPPLTSAADRGDLTLVCVPLSSFTFDASDLDEYQWARDPQQPLAAARGNSRSWSDLVAALAAGRLDYLDHPYGSVFSSMQLSLDALDESQTARQLELAVFPQDLPIPEATILRYWSQTGGVADYEARALLQAFKNKGLLNLRQDGDDALVVELHDLQRDFLLLLVDDPESMHEALLQTHVVAYGEAVDDWAWWRMPVSEPYLWDWLGLHLREAGWPDEFRRMC